MKPRWWWLARPQLVVKLFRRAASAPDAPGDAAISEWQAFEDLDEWFNETDRSFAAYMTRQWRFRHGLAVFALIFTVAPICIVIGIVIDSLPVIIAGCALFPLTPAIASLIVKVDTMSALRAVLHRRKDDNHV